MGRKGGWENESNNDNKGEKYHLMNDSSVCQELSTRGYLKMEQWDYHRQFASEWPGHQIN